MPRLRDVKNNYTSGELDPFMLGRADSKHYFNGAEKMRNVIVLPQGGFRLRGGTVKMDEIGIALTGLSATQKPTGLSASTTTLIDRSVALTTGKTVTHLGIYRSVAGAVTLKIVKRNSAGNYDIAVSQAVTHAGKGMEFFELTTPFVIPAGNYYMGAYATVAIDVVAGGSLRAHKAGNITGTAQTGFTEDTAANVFLMAPRYSDASISDTRLIGFQFSTLQHYLVMLTDHGFSIYRDGALQVAETGEAWASGQLSDVAWTQNLDTLVVYHELHRPRAVQRQGDHDEWGSFNWELKNIPNFAFSDTTYVNGVDEIQSITINLNPGDPYTLSLAGEETESIAWSSTIATNATRIRDALRALPVASATGITVSTPGSIGGPYIVTFGGEEGSRPWGTMLGSVKAGAASGAYVEVTMVTRGVYPGEPVWSSTRGWPRCGTFNAGRHWLAGSADRPQTVWASRVGDLEDFNAENTDDDYGIDVTLDADDVSSIHQIFVGRHLQLFTSSGEWYVPPSASEGLTPTNFAARRTTARGCKRGLPVFDVEGATMFVQPERKTDAEGYQRGTTIREFVFADGEQAYNSNNVSLLAAHLIRDPRRWARRTATTDLDADVLLSANADDGTMTAFVSMRGQEVNGMTLWQTAGDFLDVGVDGNDIYVVVAREIDGVTRHFLEKMVDGLKVDCGVYDFAVGSPVSTVTGLDHLNGETVWVEVDGVWRDDALVVGGEVTLDPPAEESYQVGLGWPEVDEETGDVYQVADLPVRADLPDGPISGKHMRLVETAFTLNRVRTFKINGNRFSKKVMGDDVLDTPHPEFTGSWRKRGMLGWRKEARAVIGDDRPDLGGNILSQTKAVAV